MNTQSAHNSQILQGTFCYSQTYPTCYRYGYQGSEKDDEVKGKGNHYTTEFRQLDVRLGRWFSVDPLEAKFPWQSAYMSMDGNPVNLTDVKGDQTNTDKVDKDKKDKTVGKIVKLFRRSVLKRGGQKQNDEGKYDAADGSGKDNEAFVDNEEYNNYDDWYRNTYSDEIGEESLKEEDAGEESGFAIMIGYTEATAEFNDKSWMKKIYSKPMKVHHAGIIIVDKEGNAEYFDFGRFNERKDLTREKGYGVVRSQDHVPALKLPKVDIVNGEITKASMEKMLFALKNSSALYRHKNYVTKINASVFSGLNFEKMRAFAKKQEERGQIYFGGYFGGCKKNYCAKFSRQVARRGGAYFSPLIYRGGGNVWSTAFLKKGKIFKLRNGKVTTN